MKERVGNKGLSPVIASVLMILLTLVLASIIFLWARGFVGEQIEKFGKPIEESCGEVKFDVAKFKEGPEVQLEVRNTGNVDIRHFDIKMMRDNDGNTKTERFEFSVDAGKSEKGAFEFIMTAGEPDNVIVYPALIGNVQGTNSNSIFTCIDSGVTL